jgi:hypothetical protein
MIEGVRNCSAIEQVAFGGDNDDVRHVLGQHAKLDFYSTTSLKQLFKVDMSSIRTHYPNFQTISIHPFSVLPRVKWKSSKYHFSQSTKLKTSVISITPPMQ